MGVPLEIKLRADGSDLQRDLQNIGNQVANKIKQWFTIGFALHESKEIYKSLVHIADISHQTGLRPEVLQEWQYGLAFVGESIDVLVGAMRRLAAVREDALGGNKEMQEYFAQMDIGPEKLRLMTLEELTRHIGKYLKDMEKAGMRSDEIRAKQMKFTQELMGRSAPALVDTLKRLDEWHEKTRNGVIITDEEIQRIKEMDMALTNLMMKLKAGAASAFVSTLNAIQGRPPASEIHNRIIENAVARGGQSAGFWMGVAYSRIKIAEWFKDFLGVEHDAMLEWMKDVTGIREAEAEAIAQITAEKKAAEEKRQAELEKANQVGWTEPPPPEKPEVEKIRRAKNMVGGLSSFQQIGAYVPYSDRVMMDRANKQIEIAKQQLKLLTDIFATIKPLGEIE
jgi:hypothetical protein